MPGMDISDNELAVMAGAGDAEAYRRLFERYQHPVYNFVYRLVDNAEDAADIVQNAFIKMYTVLGEKQIDNFSAYLYRTAKNLAYDEMRRRSRFADVDHEVLAPEDPNIYADPSRALMLGEQIQMVRTAVGNLNENQRAALILRELQDLDYDQMSEVLESNRNAVGALLSRARLKLREELRMAHVRTEELPEACEECIPLLSPYIDGELSGERKEWVEDHLQECTFCAAALEEMQEASRSFRMFIPVIPPAGIAHAFTGRLAEVSGQALQGAGQGGAGQGAGGQGGAEGAGQGGAGQAPGGQPDQIPVQEFGQGGYEGGYGGGQGGGQGGYGGGEEIYMQPMEATTVREAAVKRSFMQTLLHSKAAWIIAGAVVLLAVLVSGGILLAGGNGGDDNRGSPGFIDVGKTSTDDRTATQSKTTKTSATTATDAPNTTDGTATETTPTARTTGGESGGVPVSIISSSIYPNPAMQGQAIGYEVVISGKASSVGIRLASGGGDPDQYFALSKESSGGGSENWGTSAVAQGRGSFYAYAEVVSTDGEIINEYIGSVYITSFTNEY